MLFGWCVFDCGGSTPQFRGLTGDVGSLGPIGSLVTLGLYHTAVSGDVAGLSALTQLTILYLDSTAVTGDVAGLSTMTQLTWLKLDSTGVAGWPLSLPSGCSFDGPTDHNCCDGPYGDTSCHDAGR